MNLIIYPPKSPILINIFDYPIRYYGLIMAITFLVGIIVAYFIFKKRYDVKTADLFFDYAPLVIFFSVLGARLFYVLASWDYYSKNLIEIFMINHGGLSIFGAILAGVVVIYVLSKIKKFSFGKNIDVVAAVFPLCQAIGRFGNYFNQEAYGAPCDGFIKLFVDEKYRYAKYSNVEYYHPTFLYESLFDLLIFLLLFFVLFKFKTLKTGTITSLYLILYSLVRYIIEGIRIDSVLNIANFPIARLFSILIFIFGIISLIIINKKRA